MAKRVVAEFGNLHAPGQTFPSFLVQGTDVPLTALAVTRLQWHKASLAILAASTGSTWFYERQMRRNLTICTIFFFFLQEMTALVEPAVSVRVSGWRILMRGSGLWDH